jgi:hypothetical protein
MTKLEGKIAPLDGALSTRRHGVGISRGTLSETRGFLKALVELNGDRILGFTAFGVGAAEIMTSVQIAMGAGLPYTALRDTILTHPTLVEGLIPLFLSAPTTPAVQANEAHAGGNAKRYKAASD